MKIAISGKGGVGKTLLSAFLARAFAADGWDVIAIDADPDANLATALGFPDADKIVPVSHLKALIEERAGVKGGYFKLNPRVDDLPETHSVKHNGIRLMVMGEVKRGGGGCYCPENAVLSSLTAHILLGRKDVVILDMAAGIEHLSRGTARAVDLLIIVVEPGRASIDTARRVQTLGTDLGITSLAVVGNKISSHAEEEFIRSQTAGLPLLGFVPFDRGLADMQMRGLAITGSAVIESAARDIYQRLIAGPTSNTEERGTSYCGS